MIALCVLFLSLFSACSRSSTGAWRSCSANMPPTTRPKGSLSDTGRNWHGARAGWRQSASPALWKGETPPEIERALAERYMTRGDASGVRYRYWLPRAGSEEPELRLSGGAICSPATPASYLHRTASQRAAAPFESCRPAGNCRSALSRRDGPYPRLLRLYLKE